MIINKTGTYHILEVGSVVKPEFAYLSSSKKQNNRIRWFSYFFYLSYKDIFYKDISRYCCILNKKYPNSKKGFSVHIKILFFLLKSVDNYSNRFQTDALIWHITKRQFVFKNKKVMLQLKANTPFIRGQVFLASFYSQNEIIAIIFFTIL